MRFGYVKYLSMNQLADELKKLPYKKPLIILSETGAKRFGLYELLDKLHKENRVIWYSKVEPNPTQYTIFNMLNAVSAKDIDGVIASGGGSAIDLAKHFIAFEGMADLKSPDDVIDIIRRNAYLHNKNHLTLTAVPTTSGTGSEVTQWATLWDKDTGDKYSIDAPQFAPEKVWIVPELCAVMPSRVSLSSGLDALCHGMEAYWAKPSNPLSKALALQSVQLIIENLKQVLTNPMDLDLRDKMCTGALLAGMAFSQTRTTACHSISYPLTARHGIEHGFAAAITLAEIAEINSRGADINELTDLFVPYKGIQSWLDYVCEGIVELRLAYFGVNDSDLDAIVNGTFTAGRMDNNPVDLSKETVKAVLNRVMK